MKNLKVQVVTRELFAYIIVGIITTAINILCYHIFYNKMHINNLSANALAWAFSVMFAFVANDLFVFQRQNRKYTLLFRGTQFFVARLTSLAIDEVGMFFLVDRFLINSLVSKIGMNIIVVILNYVFSKRVIFRQEDTKVGN